MYARSLLILNSSCFRSNYIPRAYLRDVIETAHMFFKMLEKYCQGTGGVRVQSKKRAKPKRNNNKDKQGKASQQPEMDVSR